MAESEEREEEKEEEKLETENENMYENHDVCNILENYSRKYSNRKKVENKIENFKEIDNENKIMTEKVIKKYKKYIQLIIELSQKEKKIDKKDLSGEKEIILISGKEQFGVNYSKLIKKNDLLISGKILTDGYLSRSLNKKKK